MFGEKDDLGWGDLKNGRQRKRKIDGGGRQPN